MLIAEPPPTQADLHFRLFGVPVRVHPWFWIVSLLLGIDGSGKAEPVDTLIWVVVVFVSILVHEMGHAFLQRRFGGHPRITLYSFGGLAACEDCDRSPRSQILISLAGPVAGFLFAAVLLLAARGTGHEILSLNPANAATILEWERPFPIFQLGWKAYAVEPFATPVANIIVRDLLYINIWWGLVNLLPIYPLDGGRIAREVFTLGNPRQGIIQSLWLSVIAAGAVAVYGFMNGSLYMAIMFGILGYGSYQTLRAYEQHWR